MTTNYTLTEHPIRKELLLALDEKNVTYFEGRDENGNAHLFQVLITGLTLKDLGRQGGGLWEASGIIISKDDVQHDSSCCFRARYSHHLRKGEFQEIVGVEEFSLEYFQQKEVRQLELEIKDARDRMPQEVRELEEFANRLSKHDKAALLALHTHMLSQACIAPELHYRMRSAYKRILTARAKKPVYA